MARTVTAYCVFNSLDRCVPLVQCGMETTPTVQNESTQAPAADLSEGEGQEWVSPDKLFDNSWKQDEADELGDQSATISVDMEGSCTYGGGTTPKACKH